MRVLMNQDEVGEAVAVYLKSHLGIEAKPEEIAFRDTYAHDFMTWEQKKEDTDGE